MKNGIYISYRWITVAILGLVVIFWSGSIITAQPPVPHAVPPGLDMDCLSCHQAGVAGAPRLAWDHLGRSNDDCQQCHAISGNLSIPIGHEVEGYEDCLDCHLDGSAGAPRVAGVHTSYTANVCQNCHPSMIVEEPKIQEPEVQPEVQEEVIEAVEEEVQEELVVEEVVVEATEPADTMMSDLPSDPGCQKCHWQQAEQESHLAVVEAESLPEDQGALLFAEQCADCHGDDGKEKAFPREVKQLQALLDDPEAEVDEEELEQMMTETGGVLNDVAYLTSHDDASVMQAIIGLNREDGQHAFAEIYGGPLTWEEVIALASYIRTWDPVGPPEPAPQVAAQPGADVPNFSQDIYPIFEESCAGSCHLEKQRGDWSMESYEAVMTSGKNAPNIIPGDPDKSLLAQKLQNTQEIGKQMPLKELLPQDQIDLILEWIKAGAPQDPVGSAQPPVEQSGGDSPSFAQDIYPIFEESCAGRCHLEKQRGDWSMESYETVMTSGENAPNIIPGDPDKSLLAQKLQNTQEIGKQMPLKELLPQDQIDLILEWIRAGAPDN